MFKEIDRATAFLLAQIVMMEQEGIPSVIAKAYADLRGVTKLAEILEKRITVLKLPVVEPTAIMALVLLAPNPGKAILALIETYEKADLVHPEKITAEFVCLNVYPMGFYNDREFEDNFEFRKANRESGKYNFII
jgi:hypothetical protein